MSALALFVALGALVLHFVPEGIALRVRLKPKHKYRWARRLPSGPKKGDA